MVDGRSPRGLSRATGYNLVALMVLVAVINITVAAALPSVSQAMRREKEAELIFRGLQYAEAIRVFQLRTGRYPVSLRELLKNNPRCIRQLWTDPFNDTGEWGVILAQGGPGGRQVGEIDAAENQQSDQRSRSRRRRQPSLPEELEPRENVSDPDHSGTPRSGQTVARGPIIGVKSLSHDESVGSFMGAEKYSEWLFTVDLVPTLEVTAIGENVPRLHTLWVGKPVPDGLEEAQSGTVPTDRGRNRPKNPLDKKSGRRSPREGSRTNG